MIRFIDLTEEYWTDPDVGFPVCAFLSTNTDCFLQTSEGHHTFHEDEIAEHPQSERLLALVPEGFFDEGVNHDYT